MALQLSTLGVHALSATLNDALPGQGTNVKGARVQRARSAMAEGSGASLAVDVGPEHCGAAAVAFQGTALERFCGAVQTFIQSLVRKLVLFARHALSHTVLHLATCARHHL